MRNQSRVDYETRLNRVIGYIEDHLADDLPLEALARRAYLSPYHFHRVFRAMTGEAVFGFVKRRRLERAARALYHDAEASVLEVAQAHGYESAAAFTRAFRTAFGVGPSDWRRRAAAAWVAARFEEKEAVRQKSKIGKEVTTTLWQKLAGDTRDPASNTQAARPAGRATVVQLPTVAVVYLRYVGTYGSLDITRMWDRLMRRADTAGLVHRTTTCVGVLHDDPAITRPAACRYDACVVVPESAAGGGGVAGLSFATIRGGTYLAFPFLGRPENVDPAWDAVYAQLTKSGRLPANQPNLEWYEPGSIVDAEQMIFRAKLCVALKPRQTL